MTRADRSPPRSPPVLPLTLAVGQGREEVTLRLEAQGRDLVLSIRGGEAHVGAVAVRSPAGGTRGEAHSALVLIPGHKEGPLAEAAASRLAVATGRTCVVIAGIHQEAATPAEISAIVANVRAGVEQLAARLHAGCGSPDVSA
jgi:hypothetical protein